MPVAWYAQHVSAAEKKDMYLHGLHRHDVHSEIRSELCGLLQVMVTESSLQAAQGNQGSDPPQALPYSPMHIGCNDTMG